MWMLLFQFVTTGFALKCVEPFCYIIINWFIIVFIKELMQIIVIIIMSTNFNKVNR